MGPRGQLQPLLLRGRKKTGFAGVPCSGGFGSRVINTAKAFCHLEFYLRILDFLRLAKKWGRML